MEPKELSRPANLAASRHHFAASVMGLVRRPGILHLVGSARHILSGDDAALWGLCVPHFLGLPLGVLGRSGADVTGAGNDRPPIADSRVGERRIHAAIMGTRAHQRWPDPPPPTALGTLLVWDSGPWEALANRFLAGDGRSDHARPVCFADAQGFQPVTLLAGRPGSDSTDGPHSAASRVFFRKTTISRSWSRADHWPKRTIP